MNQHETLDSYLARCEESPELFSAAQVRSLLKRQYSITAISVAWAAEDISPNEETDLFKPGDQAVRGKIVRIRKLMKGHNGHSYILNRLHSAKEANALKELTRRLEDIARLAGCYQPGAANEYAFAILEVNDKSLVLPPEKHLSTPFLKISQTIESIASELQPQLDLGMRP